mmetsp:Transcript_39781/g.79737  ORF Transcript_39781/g.79737 Transcript_39781/m.79737 type:complete len:184 (+) Transcript_39781:108-659(+)
MVSIVRTSSVDFHATTWKDCKKAAVATSVSLIARAPKSQVLRVRKFEEDTGVDSDVDEDALRPNWKPPPFPSTKEVQKESAIMRTFMGLISRTSSTESRTAGKILTRAPSTSNVRKPCRATSMSKNFPPPRSSSLPCDNPRREHEARFVEDLTARLEAIVLAGNGSDDEGLGNCFLELNSERA